MSKPVASYEIVDQAPSWLRVHVALDRSFNGFVSQTLTLPRPEFDDQATLRQRVCIKLKQETGLTYEPDEIEMTEGTVKPELQVEDAPAGTVQEPKKKRKGK